MKVSEISGRVLVSIITVIILAVLVVSWSWLTTGGLLEYIGGAKKQYVEDLINTEVTNQLSGVHLPVDTVVAFEKVKCPKGWLPYEKADGRFIIGAGKGELRNKLNVGDIGGMEFVTLVESNMPSHQHGSIIHASSEEGEKKEEERRGWGNDRQINPAPKTTKGTGKWKNDGGFFLTSPAGKGEAHDNMPPYIALRFCQKQRKQKP